PRSRAARIGARQGARGLVRNAAKELEDAGVPEPVASAEVLLSELLDTRRGDLTLRDQPLTREQAALYRAWIQRRIKREPVQRILGYSYFRNLRLDLDYHTLIPRPDTESVVEAALEAIDSWVGTCRVLDIGTGSGAIAISIAQERPSCEVHATDNSEGALRVARGNAERAGATVRFHQADLTSGLEDLAGSIDLLISNPPYVRSSAILELAPEVRDWDPRAALDGGRDGLDFYRRIFVEAVPLLAEETDVVLEVGDGQAEAVLDLGQRAGYRSLGTRPDLTGKSRAVLLRSQRPLNCA
ncbi:MAG: peptide chain release factor N(5)-glutamine methyltransferase, partial [Actinomycetota bacterium]|nr:peptide chain release factor N(5)-glutamine methyltransferase [Actinomycetota bacterium]